MGRTEIDGAGVTRAAGDYRAAAGTLAQAADRVRDHPLVESAFGRHYVAGARACLTGLDRLAGGIALWCTGARAVEAGLSMSVAALTGADGAGGTGILRAGGGPTPTGGEAGDGR